MKSSGALLLWTPKNVEDIHYGTGRIRRLRTRACEQEKIAGRKNRHHCKTLGMIIDIIMALDIAEDSESELMSSKKIAEKNSRHHCKKIGTIIDINQLRLFREHC